MIDEVAIQQTLNRYTESSSRAAWEEATATYTPDGVWELASSGQKVVGPAAIGAALASFTAAVDYVVQINAPAVIVVDGDKATARSVIRERAKLKGKDEGFEAIGFYADKLIRTPDGWKFTHRLFETKAIQRFSLLPTT